METEGPEALHPDQMLLQKGILLRKGGIDATKSRAGREILDLLEVQTECLAELVRLVTELVGKE